MRNGQLGDVAERLLQAGVSPKRVRRTASELSDHFDDLRQEMIASGLSNDEANAEAYARLRVDLLVDSYLTSSGAQSWVRRWPLPAFTVLPLVIYSALFVSAVAILPASAELAKAALGFDLATSNALRCFGQAYLNSVVWLSPIAAAAACCAIALARRASATWAVIAVVLIGSIGALTNAQLQIPPTGPATTINAGIGISTESLLLPAIRAAVTLIVVLLAYFWLRQAQKQSTSASSVRFERSHVPRIAIFLAVVAAHIGLIGLFNISRTTHSAAVAEDRRMTVVLLSMPPTYKPLELPTHPASSNPKTGDGVSPHQAKPEIARDPTTSPQENDASSKVAPAAIDWATQAQLAAARQVDSLEQSHQPDRGFPSTGLMRDSPKETHKPDFGWSHSRTNRIEQLPQGGTLIWINERCAIVFSGFVLLPACQLGKIEARGDLFEHMQPPAQPGDWKER
jgi:hypothetical protein